MANRAFRRWVVAVVALGSATSMSPGEVRAQPHGRDGPCAGLAPSSRAICLNFLKLGCDGDPRPPCGPLRRVFSQLTGSDQFPFENTPTPTATPTSTATLTPTATETPVAAGVAMVGPRPASLLVYPRVLADGTRDTIIQLSDVNSSATAVHCFYINGAPLDPTMPVSPANPRLWTATDFQVQLTAHHPTQWRVSTGRPNIPGDPPGSPGAGTDPGLVPPVPAPFTGELRCYQTDDSYAPIGGNALTGAATLLGPGFEVAGYDAIGFRGLNVDGDTILHLDGVEYDSCAEDLFFEHRADGVFSIGQVQIAVHPTLTVVPCTVDVETQFPVKGPLLAFFTDEFEQSLSGAALALHWNEFGVADFPAMAGFGAFFKLARLRTAAGKSCVEGDGSAIACNTDADCGTGGVCQRLSFLAVLETAISSPGGPVIEVRNPQVSGSQPEDFVRVLSPPGGP